MGRLAWYGLSCNMACRGSLASTLADLVAADQRLAAG
jgi:hypothetical protein